MPIAPMPIRPAMIASTMRNTAQPVAIMNATLSSRRNIVKSELQGTLNLLCAIIRACSRTIAPPGKTRLQLLSSAAQRASDRLRLSTQFAHPEASVLSAFELSYFSMLSHIVSTSRLLFAFLKIFSAC